jgi:predicted O-methyltransferase YrrM
VYSRRQLLFKYLSHYFTASNGKGHGIHSPFVFDFVQKVLIDKRSFYAYSQIEKLRNRLLQDPTIIQVEDFGAGSAVTKNKSRTISDIVKYASKNEKMAQLIFRVANHYQPKTIVELGTSLGISSAYLASACPNAKLFTIEGSAAIASMASQNIQSLGLHNIEIITGNFDDSIANVIERAGKIDLAFIDGNHRKEPTLSYFAELLEHAHPLSIFIFDDIHWSEEMEQAWDFIKKNKRATLTIDLFFLGLVFFREDFKVKQHFTIRF